MKIRFLPAYCSSCILSLVMVCSFQSISSASDTPSIEYQIKASLIFNFVQFIEWPTLPDEASGNFKICVYGQDQFGPALSYFEREVVFGMRIKKVLVANRSEEIKNCQVLYIPESQQPEEEELIRSVSELGVLTIGESENFLGKGGIIRLAEANKKIVFDINRKASLLAHFNITSKLLRLARQVID